MPKLTVFLKADESYTADLRKRLVRYGITQSDLARATLISPTQLTRWFNTDMEPSLTNVRKIELAIARIRAKQERRK